MDFNNNNKLFTSNIHLLLQHKEMLQEERYLGHLVRVSLEASIDSNDRRCIRNDINNNNRLP